MRHSNLEMSDGDQTATSLDVRVTAALPGEIAPELTGHGLPLGKCEAYNRVYDQPYGTS